MLYSTVLHSPSHTHIHKAHLLAAQFGGSASCSRTLRHADLGRLGIKLPTFRLEDDHSIPSATAAPNMAISIWLSSTCRNCLKYTIVLAWMPDELSPAHNIFGRELRAPARRTHGARTWLRVPGRSAACARRVPLTSGDIRHFLVQPTQKLSVFQCELRSSNDSRQTLHVCDKY